MDSVAVLQILAGGLGYLVRHLGEKVVCGVVPACTALLGAARTLFRFLLLL